MNIRVDARVSSKTAIVVGNSIISSKQLGFGTSGCRQAPGQRLGELSLLGRYYCDNVTLEQSKCHNRGSWFALSSFSVLNGSDATTISG
jgi:hypothetical protein